MNLRSEHAGIAARVLAVISLFVGLTDAARLLGVWGGPQSPLTTFGSTGFALLAILAVARLFASLGLWLQVQWGAVLLAVALFVELSLSLIGNPVLAMPLFGFIFKLVVLLATIGLIAFSLFRYRQSVAD